VQLLANLKSGESDILARALDPSDPGVAVVAWPGRRIAAPLQNGDIIVRQPLSGPVRSFMLTGEMSENGYAAGKATDIATSTFGGPLDVSFRLHGPDRMLRDDLTVVRIVRQPTEQIYDEITVLPPQAASRPTIRQGSRGPAVNEAQQRLNTINTRRLAGGQSRIDRCPLVVDGIFGSNTRGATVSFQRLAFPGQANEWDGIIGPKTWAKLDAWSFEQPVYPTPPVLPPPPSINPPNIIPIVFRPPNPARWGPLLGGLSNAPVRTHNAVRSLIDGPATYRSMLADLRRANNARSFIYLLGWDCYDNFPLDPSATPPCSTSLNQVLTDAVAAGAQVRAMVWRNLTGRDKLRAVGEVATRINALRSPTGNGACIVDSRAGGATPVRPETVRDILTAMTTAFSPLTLLPGIGDQVQRLNTELARRIDQAVREMLAAHHQKVLIIFDGEQLISYCGGIDFNPNRATVATNCIPRSTPQIIEPSDPQHDTHCRIIGPAARDLLATFVDRWLDHPDHAGIDRASGALRGAPVSSVPAPPVPNPSTVDAPAGGSTSVIIARTYNAPRSGAIPRQRDIRTLLLRAISNAESFIYLEDQYLWDFDTPLGGTLSVATALNRALPRLRHITALIPANAISAPAPFQRAWRQRFMNEVRRGHSREIADRFQVYQLNRGSCTDDGCLGSHTYVHSKCWVFDDELAVVGSANCNRRGYQHDSEVDAFIWDDVSPTTPGIPGGFDPGSILTALANPGDFATEQVASGPTFAQQFRTRLWREHLGVTVSDGADNSNWPTGSSAVGSVVRFKADRPLIIGPRADPIAFPIIDGIAESVRPIFDPVSP
jgi:phosphatidylserine/phosphatidylglycerophosphate/cardiolipin synthase-like enzyme